MHCCLGYALLSNLNFCSFVYPCAGMSLLVIWYFASDCYIKEVKNYLLLCVCELKLNFRHVWTSELI
uniref:Uncharacterized protein n=1 Tax=Rhizophora mucronata TaxID=61149 RepID=A0A2P2PY47_RHIMU